MCVWGGDHLRYLSGRGVLIFGFVNTHDICGGGGGGGGARTASLMSMTFCWNYQAHCMKFTCCMCCIAGMVLCIAHVKIL